VLLVLCNECKQYEYFVHTIQEYKIQTIQPIRDATPNRDAICPRNSMQQNALDPIIYHTPSIFPNIPSLNISLPTSRLYPTKHKRFDRTKEMVEHRDSDPNRYIPNSSTLGQFHPPFQFFVLVSFPIFHLLLDEVSTLRSHVIF
jgi:hypothetical protein